MKNKIDRTLREFLPHRDYEYIPDLTTALLSLFTKHLEVDEGKIREILMNTDYMDYSVITGDREVNENKIAQAIKQHLGDYKVGQDE